MSTELSRTRITHPGALLVCAVCLGFSIVCGLGWLNARREVELLRVELQFASSEARDIRQQLEAERLIGHRQIEMLREHQNPAPKTSP
jgi:hypothetical protein